MKNFSVFWIVLALIFTAVGTPSQTLAQQSSIFQQWQKKWSIKATKVSLPRSTQLSKKPIGRLRAIERHIGLHERKDRSIIHQIVGVDPRGTPWCGYAAAYALKANGEQPVKGYPKAFSWKRHGKAVSLHSAPAGAIVVYKHSHVAILKGRSGKSHHISCGGNMSDRFKCSRYRNSSVLAVRL